MRVHAVDRTCGTESVVDVSLRHIQMRGRILAWTKIRSDYLSAESLDQTSLVMQMAKSST
jgi:hypothetical protein